ncbi:MAG TPA: YigZ family protein [Prevotellaceae bacterium]|nr:YigZ family protein [Prevotellaceae bacterium]
MVDEYRTITKASQGTYSELRSRFLGFAHHVTTPEEALALVSDCQKKYYDARHVCWAYMLGAEREVFRSNDNGEPSGTAGKPILGQINSRELTDVIVLVVRYFGGVKLGTGGLIEAYRTTAAATLDAAQVETRTVDGTCSADFDYADMNAVMRVSRMMGARIVEQTCDLQCHMTFSIRMGRLDELERRLDCALRHIPFE